MMECKGYPYHIVYKKSKIVLVSKVKIQNDILINNKSEGRKKL